MRSALLVLLVFVLLTIGMTWPLILHAATGVEDLHDALLNTWILAWDGHQLLSDPLHLFDANIFHPYGDTLAFSEIILPQALLALPLTLLTDNPVLGYNVALLASFVLCAFAAYLLVLRMTGSQWAGVAAGIVFSFNAYKMSNLAQAQLLAVQWLPLALLYVARTLRPRRTAQHSRYLAWRAALLLTVFVALQALSSFYYAIISAVAIALAMLVAVLLRRIASWGGFLRLVLALALAALIVMPFTLPYLRVESVLGFTRALADSEPFSASLAQYAQSLPTSVLYSGLVAQSPVVIGGYALDSLFPGVATLILALIGLIAWRRSPHLWVYPTVLTLGGFVLSLGPTLHLSPGQTVDLPLPLPYRLLYLLPGMQALRAPVRFSVLVFLGLSLLVGLAIAALTGGRGRSAAQERARRILGWLAGAALAVILVADVAAWRTAAIIEAPTGNNVPALYRWLAEQEPGVVLELPMMAATPERGLLTQYFSAYHWQGTPDGYSGFVPPKHGEIAYEMESFPSERSVSLLQGLGVRYLVLHSDLMANWQERAVAIASYSTDLTYERKVGDSFVYRVERRADLGRIQPRLYLPSQAGATGPYIASLIVANSAGRSAITLPTEKATIEALWRTAGNVVTRRESTNVALPVVVAQAGVAAVYLQPPSGGTYNLSITTRLPQGGDVTETATVTIKSGNAAVAQAVPVQLLSGVANKRSYQPGETIQVALRWRALGKVDAYYSIFVRLLDSNGRAIAQKDGQPGRGTRPTLLWRPGEDILDNWQLELPPDAPPGVYTLEAGMYLPADLSPRLTLGSEGRPAERLLLGLLRVAPPLSLTKTPDLPLQAAFAGRATLLGYNIEGCTWIDRSCHAPAGTQLTVTLYWQADAEMTVDYSVFLHLADANGKPLAQHDGRPQDGRYPTTVWLRGDVVADAHTIRVPHDAAGQLQLVAGLYDPVTTMRVATAYDGDAVPLVTISIR